LNKINRHNYELFFLDFAEGNLSKSQIDDLNIFLTENPELKNEFDSFENIKLIPKDIEYKHKDELIKQTQDKLFNVTNFEYLAIAELENDISENEKDALNIIISKDKELSQSLKIFKRTKLKANENVIFNHKDKLRRSVVPIFIKNSSIAIAATFALFFLINQLFFIDNETKAIQFANVKHSSKNNSIKNITQAQKKDIKTQNKKQKFSISHKQTINRLTTNEIFAFDDNESQKNVDIYNKLNVSIPDLKTETLIFEKNKLEIKNSYKDIAYNIPKIKHEKDKLWEYAETGVKVWKLVSSSDLEMNNKYKKDGRINTKKMVALKN